MVRALAGIKIMSKHYNIAEKHPNYKHGFSLDRHYCNCGKEIHWTTALNGGNCQSCSSKIRFQDIENHPMFRKKHTEKTKQKMRNKIVSKETKDKISKNHSNVSGKNNPFFGKKHTKETKQKLSLKNKNRPSLFKGKKHTKASKKLISKRALGRVMSDKTKQKISEAMMGKHAGSKNPMFGRSGKSSPTFGRIMNIPSKVVYNNTNMRSIWEVNFAKWLHLSNVKWKYESKTFDLGDCTYTPDFYLPEFDCYIEIKGYLTDYARNKINKFKKLYNDINFKLYKEKKLKQIGVI